MIKHLLAFFGSLLLLAAANAQTSPWEQIYNNPGLVNGYSTMSFLTKNSEGTLFIAEQDLDDVNWMGDFLNVKSYDGTNWTLVGQRIPLNLPNNENHVDFVIAPNNQMYVGIGDSIFVFNAAAQKWEGHFVPNYVGGLAADENSQVYFIHREQGAGGIVYSDLKLARFENGSHTIVETIATNLMMIPRKVNGSNRIVIRNNVFHVSAVGQSTNLLFVFRGAPTTGFSRLGGTQQIWATLGLSSLAVGPDNAVLVSHKTPTPNSRLGIISYNAGSDTWQTFDTTGIASASCNVNRLIYDNNDVLHLIYNGSNGTGFVFKYTSTGWEHIGPRNLNTLLSVSNPGILFDNNNVLHFTTGIGSSLIPLRVFRYRVTTDIAQTNAPVPSVEVYPNPAVYQLNIRNNASSAVLKVFDLSGRILHQTAMQEKSLQLDVSAYATGLYLLQLENEAGKTVTKFSVSR